MVARLHSLKGNAERVWFLVKIKVRDWAERNFFSLTVFGGNLLADDIHASVTMDRHVQA